MKLSPRLLILSCMLLLSTSISAQLQFDRLSFKGFNATGFGGFFNFSVPVSEADYITGEMGLDVFSSNGNNVVLVPLLAGYRYSINRSGTGFYVEPNIGYSIGATDIQLQDAGGNYYDQKISGAATGVGVGYLFEPAGRIQFNLAIRYEHVFGNAGQNLLSFRISHAFTFGRRQ